MSFFSALAPIFSAVGSVVSLIGGVSQANAQKQQLNYQAAIANNNAIIAQQNQEYAAKAGAAQAQQVSLQEAQRLGAVKAAIAANNVDVNTGSAATVQESQRETGTLNALTTENNALLQAYGYGVQAQQYASQAGLYQTAASNVSYLGAAGSGLGGLGNLPTKFGSIFGSSPTNQYDPITGQMFSASA
jgi:hypothetical protein